MVKSDNPFHRVIEESPNQPYQADWEDDYGFLFEYMCHLVFYFLMLPPYYNHLNLLAYGK